MRSGASSALTFVVCIEPGHRLEYKAAALFATMRAHMGGLSSAQVWAYSPRPDVTVAPWVRDLMDHFEVRHVEEPLNERHAAYPLANKPIALAHAEAHAATEFVTFLDSDILAWKEPVAFCLPDGIDASLVPDGTKTTASSGPGDPFESYWQRLYELAGVQAEPYVTTILSNERVRGSWNSGVVPLRRSAGIAKEWLRCLEALLTQDFSPAEASYLKENNVLSAVLCARQGRFQELPLSYNYPVQNWRAMTAKGTTPEEAHLWHYQPFFDRTFRAFAERMDTRSSLAERLELTRALVADLRLNYRRRVGLDETWLRGLRRRLRLGPRLRAMLGRTKPTDSTF